jgi:hypothetical protein
MVDQAHFARPDLTVDAVIIGDRFGNWWTSYSLNLLSSFPRFPALGNHELNCQYKIGPTA